MGVCGTDMSGYLGKMPFIQLPRILGHELGVEVLSVGSGVTSVRPGQKCSVEPYLHCGDCHACHCGRPNCCEALQVLGVHCDGGLTERILVPADKLHPADDLSFEQLALVEMLAIGRHAVQRAALAHGEEVLILGAGPIGLSVLEFALIAGVKVSIFDPNPVRRQFVSQTYPTATVLALPPLHCSAQVVFDATGNATSMADSLLYAKFTGRIIFVGITKEPIPLDDALLHRRELTLLASRNALAADFTAIIQLIRQGHLHTQRWLTHRSSLAEAPADFARWAEPEAQVVKAIIRVC